MTRWDPGLYLRFDKQRTRPAADLVDRIAIESPARVVDLGCGPGNSTAQLRRRWPRAAITGVDSSAEMLAQARQNDPATTWEQADVGAWRADPPVDLIFSNACLQWVPNHAALLPRLMESVAPGGALGLQLPYHFESALHRELHRISRQEPWADRLEPARTRLRVESPEFYYDVLAPLAGEVDLWITQYIHVMPGAEAILDWIRATGLRPFLAALENEDERTEFEERYLEALCEVYPEQLDGRVLFTFPRLFIVAYKP